MRPPRGVQREAAFDSRTAIRLEQVAIRHAAQPLWPADRQARAVTRRVCAELNPLALLGAADKRFEQAEQQAVGKLGLDRRGHLDPRPGDRDE